MNPVIQKLHEAQLRKDLPEFRPGDTVRVNVRLQEGEGEKVKERLQAFEGVVISKKGRASGATFTVRRVSFGVGIERIFPLHSPTISSIEVVGKGKVRRARLYYLRDLKGKAARIKRAGRGEVLFVPCDAAVDGIDVVFNLAQAVALARIAHENGLGAHVFQGNEELLGFGDGDIVVVFAMHQHRRRVSGSHMLQR